MINENYKTTYILTLIGVVLGYLGAVFLLLLFFAVKYFLPVIKDLNFGATVSSVTPQLITMAYVSILIHLVGALIVSSVLIYYLTKIKSKPSSTDLVVVLIFGIFELYFVWYAGIFVLIGAIIGLIKYGKLTANKSIVVQNTVTKEEQNTLQKSKVKKVGVKKRIQKTKRK